MIFTATPLSGSFLVTPQPQNDSRGWFSRTFCKNSFLQIGHTAEWVQMNHSFTIQKGSIRGLHFQRPPYEEIKMVRCIAGAVYDVIVDIRKNSPTFLKWYGTELSATNKNMIYIPTGFAHGFQTITNDVELLYHHSGFYTPGFEGGLLYNDPLLSIHWPLTVSQISERDMAHPILNSNFKPI